MIIGLSPHASARARRRMLVEVDAQMMRGDDDGGDDERVDDFADAGAVGIEMPVMEERSDKSDT
jgi:hypothetical protein